MDCVNHLGMTATAYCQNCGRALCANCVRSAAGGQLLCEPCWTAQQGYQQPFAAAIASGPNPAVAAGLGVIPGVGAMYNGQFIKGFIHVIVFAVLISLVSTIHSDLDIFFGLMIPAWILYQSFEAFHTAKALRDGQPLPDPLGLNEVGNWLNRGARPQNPGQPGSGPGSFGAGPFGPGGAGAHSEAQQPGTQAQPPYQTPYQQGPNAGPGPTPFVQPIWGYCGRREPVGAIVLIGLGLIFLLGQFDIFHAIIGRFGWPLLMIALGVWLIVRRLGDSRGGPK